MSGVVFTNVDGDQPGVMMNLYRFVKGIGVRPVMCGNVKGLHDPYRNPTTQEGFAKKWGQQVAMVTSFADGTKISFEQAIVGNGCDFRVLRRGMMGPTVETGTPITEAVTAFPEERLLEGGGWVDYVVGAAPSPGVFVLGTIDQLIDVPPAPKPMKPATKLRYSYQHCVHCTERAYLTLEKVWHELGDDGAPEENTEAVHSDVEVHKSDLAKLHALKEQLRSMSLA